MLPHRQQPALRRAIENALSSEDGTPHVIDDADIEATAVSLAAAGLGIAIVPASSKHAAPSGVTFIQVRASLPLAEFEAVVSKKNPLPAAELFLEHLIRQSCD